MTFFPRQARFASILLTTSFLTACGSFEMPEIAMPNLGLSPEPVAAIDRPLPDTRGVITYQTYQVMVARTGDTFSTMAARVGLSGEELARHNGRSLAYTPRAGENFAIPRNVGGSVVSSPTGWAPDVAISAIDSSGVITVTEPATGTPDEPLRHRVEAGETAYSVARLYNVSVTALASWNGLGADLAVREGQQLTIPVAAAVTIPTAVVTPPVVIAPTVTPAVVTPPVVTAPSSIFMKPVEGAVARAYSAQSGVNKNDGIDYAAPAGSDVKAAAVGLVALVSASTGALGTIVLVRHEGDLLTIYGRVDNVTVAKGDTVQRGQVIGVVAAGDPATMHFEVRKGTTSVDPAPYLN